MRAAVGPGGQIFQAFVEGGATRQLVVGAVWREFDPAGCDLFLRFNPENSLRVLSASTTDTPGLVDGAAFIPTHRQFVMPVEPGWSIRGYDRSGGNPRFFFVCDPAIAGEDVMLLFRENAR